MSALHRAQNSSGARGAFVRWRTHRHRGKTNLADGRLQHATAVPCHGSARSLLGVPHSNTIRPVPALIDSLSIALEVLRVVFLVVAGVALAVCGVDWAVRTRRINPFSGVARFFRRSVDPLLAPIERRVVRGGGLPSTAPWWALGAVVLGGIVVLVVLGFVRNQLARLATTAASFGGSGIAQVVVSWAVGVFQLALIVRVVLSWVRLSEHSRWVRWAVVLTEPLLRPLRRVVPPIGVIDITPIIAYFLVWIVSGFVMSVL